MPVERECYGTYSSGNGGANWSYEHHNLDEPAVDCWNVTDGIVNCATRLTSREGNWNDYFETYGPYLLDSTDHERLSHEIHIPKVPLLRNLLFSMNPYTTMLLVFLNSSNP